MCLPAVRWSELGWWSEMWVRPQLWPCRGQVSELLAAGTQLWWIEVAEKPESHTNIHKTLTNSGAFSLSIQVLCFTLTGTCWTWGAMVWTGGLAVVARIGAVVVSPWTWVWMATGWTLEGEDDKGVLPLLGLPAAKQWRHKDSFSPESIMDYSKLSIHLGPFALNWTVNQLLH